MSNIIKCPECEFINEEEDFCINCGTDLKGKVLPGSADFKMSVSERNCSCCGYSVKTHEEICSFCGFEETFGKISSVIVSDVNKENSSVDTGEELYNRDEKSEPVSDIRVKENERSVKKQDTIILTVSSNFLYLSGASFVFFMIILFIFIFHALKRQSDTGYIPVSSPSTAGNVITENNNTSEDAEMKPSPEMKLPTSKPLTYSTPTSTPERVPAFTALPTAIILVITPVPTKRSYPVATRKPLITYQYPSPTAVLQINDKQTKRIYCNSVLSGKVMTLYNERRYTEAINECNSLINYEPTYYSNYIWMASCYLAAKDPEDAKYYIDKALEYEWQEKRLPREQLESEKLYQLYLKYGGKN